jgi:oligoendopeptidase F
MVQYRLYDISYSPLKAEMSFQTYLPSYEVPFLFMDASGELGDITTFSHEFGHYLDGFTNFDEDETVDLAECYSQAMELLMLTRLDGELSQQELESLYEIKMLDILGMYVQQAAFAEFEHIVYAADPEELTPEFLNDTFLRLSQEYGFCEDGFEDLYAMLWQDITHFFEQPFYVITYPVSHDIAMQIFQLERANPGAGLETFLTMLPREYPDMLDTALNAGLESPFDPGRLEKVAETMREILLDDALENAA